MTFSCEQELENAFVMHTYGRMPVEFVGGEGMTLIGSDGRRYTDFLSGIGVCCLGHGHPVLKRAVEEQVERLMHVSNYFYIEHRGEVAALISKLANNDLDGARALVEALDSGDEAAVAAAAAPAEGEQVWKTFFANSGAEANEGSMKLARLYARRLGNGGNTIVSLNGSFHGRTLETIAATMQDRLQDSFRPLPEGFVACEPNDVAGLERIVSELGSEICAFMFEPIQGESGVHPLTPEFLRTAEELVHGVGGVLIADEVQTGVFRTGAPFAVQLLGVEPDIMSLAKGIAGGVPAGACVAKEEIARAFKPGDHGSTFGGSCLAVAAAQAVLSELVRGGYAERVTEVGEYLAERLGRVAHVTEVRGAGLMVGIELDEAAGDAHDVVAALLEKGFVANATGATTLRLLPPLICSTADADAFAEVLGEILG